MASGSGVTSSSALRSKIIPLPDRQRGSEAKPGWNGILSTLALKDDNYIFFEYLAYKAYLIILCINDAISSTSKVVALIFKIGRQCFCVIWKGVCHSRLVINSDFGPISHRFRDMASFPLKTHIFLPSSIQPHIWNYPPSTASLKFCMQRASTKKPNHLKKTFPKTYLN